MIKIVIFDLYGTIMTSKEGIETRYEALSRILRTCVDKSLYKEFLVV